MNKRWMVALRVAITMLIVWFIGRRLAGNWASYRSANVTITVHWSWLLASIGWVAVTYALQIASWQAIIGGWRQRIGFVHAAQAWTLANLGRYVPGKVWSVAGLVVLAARRGVAMWASAASAFVIQGLGIGTAFAMIAIMLPGHIKPVYIALGALGAVASMLVLGSAKLMRRAARLAGDRFPVQPLPPAALAISTLLTFAGWATYGLAFWSLARGLGYGQGTAFTPPMAMGMFAAAYMAGHLALFMPGGIGVREVAFGVLLPPLIGVGGAIALSLASRLELTVMEPLAAGAAALAARRIPHLESTVDEPTRGER